jgi:hypothetical protein
MPIPGLTQRTVHHPFSAWHRFAQRPHTDLIVTDRVLPCGVAPRNSKVASHVASDLSLYGPSLIRRKRTSLVRFASMLAHAMEAIVDKRGPAIV